MLIAKSETPEGPKTTNEKTKHDLETKISNQMLTHRINGTKVVGHEAIWSSSASNSS